MSSAPLRPARASTSWPHTTCGAPVRLVAIESEGVPICRLWLPEMQYVLVPIVCPPVEGKGDLAPRRALCYRRAGAGGPL
jgi:hypothetical protein